jgi:NADH-quinone oxidoreductase subunit L
MKLEIVSILILLSPFVGFLINGLFGKNLSKSLVGIIGSGALLASFVGTMALLFKDASFTTHLFNFFDIGNFKAEVALQIDHLSLMMMSIITGIGFLIHIYSIGYMHDDEGYHKFFAYLNLFVFSMLTLVMGASYLLMFFGWEGVGLCSYLLIGFWFKNQEYNNAAKKAFIMNRVGDLGFLMGMFGLYQLVGSLEYSKVMAFDFAAIASTNQHTLIMITLCLFVGAMGKSAQLPLYTWLPDAMAGPTPVSALIHAATMVTAGIYMIVRSNAIFIVTPFTMEVIAIIGLATALFAGTIAIYQKDIKKVLAYSTVSQLGYMFLALGVSAFTSGMFHLMTHAFFKALLFLGAGSVIHAMSGEQDITKMGGLSKKIPITFWTFTIGVLAIVGFPLTSGFVSKDEILVAVYNHNKIYFILAAIGALMTIFYMLRMYFLTFFGTFRGTHDQEHHLHESPSTMTIPLIVLAVLSLLGGAIQFPEMIHGHPYLNNFLHSIVEAKAEHEEGMFGIIMLVATIIGLAIIYVITKKKFSVSSYNTEYTGIGKVLENKYYVDEAYEFLFVKPTMSASKLWHQYFDKKVIDGLVFMTGKFVTWSGTTLKYVQNGLTGSYIFMMVCAIAIILGLNLMRIFHIWFFN